VVILSIRYNRESLITGKINKNEIFIFFPLSATCRFKRVLASRTNKYAFDLRAATGSGTAEV
jgi:hypothetical protein